MSSSRVHRTRPTCGAVQAYNAGGELIRVGKLIQEAGVPPNPEPIAGARMSSYPSVAQKPHIAQLARVHWPCEIVPRLRL